MVRNLASLCDSQQIVAYISKYILHATEWSKHLLTAVVDDAFKVSKNATLSTLVFSDTWFRVSGLTTDAARAYFVHCAGWAPELPDSYFMAAFTESLVPEAYAELMKLFNESLGKL